MDGYGECLIYAFWYPNTREVFLNWRRQQVKKGWVEKCCVVHVDNMVINIVITNLNADLSDLLVELIELVRQ